MTLRYALLFALLMSIGSLEVPAAGHDLDWAELLAEPDPELLVSLATRYEQGARRDYGRARQLYCAAARLGHTPAQVRLAWMYANGVGAPQDIELAGAWLRVAAAEGDLQARKFLALLGYPARGRQPRCTYSSRFDSYARATIPSSSPEGDSTADETALASWSTEKSTVDAEALPTQPQIEQWVRRLAPSYGLDPELALAIIRVESNFDPYARSPGGAWGLMQLNPDTADRFGVRDSTHPIQNLHGGMSYLRWLLAYFGGDLRLALAGYHAGETTVEQFLEIPPYPKTRAFVSEVVRVYGRSTHPRVHQVVERSAILPATPLKEQPE